MKQTSEEGIVGVLIGALISVLAVGFLFVMWMYAPTNEESIESGLQPLTASGTVPVNQIERYQADMNAAREVQKSVNIQSDNLTQTLEEL